jgi:hypothetical protein
LSKRPAGALAGIAMILLLVASPAGAGVRRDTVIEGAGAARTSALGSTGRYPIGDGNGTTVTVVVTATCQASCTAADPQAIASFLGTLTHGPEMEWLTVQLDTPSQIEFDCGFGAQACYYPSESRIVLGGNATLAPDGASREFVLAHEYGHHVARNRETPPPFPPALDWGTARWASYEHVCQRSRAGALFPGDEGLRYFRDPGEAFAEAFARNRFPETGTPWRWVAALKPDAGAFEAIREDTLRPWSGRTAFALGGQLPPRSATTTRAFRTPLDGTVSLAPLGRPRYALSLLSRSGRVLRSERYRSGPGRRLNFTVCGQAKLRVAVRSARRRGAAFELRIQRP